MTSRPMSNIDKQWLQHKIADMEAACDEIPFGLDEDDSNTLAAMKLALASLEAEVVAYIRSAHNPDGFCFADGIHPTHRHQRLPLSTLQDGCYWKVTPLYTAPPAPANAEPVAWLWSHRKHPSEVTLVRSEDDERAEGAHWSGWSCQALYAAPPVPVSVPDDVSGPLAHAYKELTHTFMRNHIGVFERYGIYPDGSAGIQAMRIALDGMNRRAAMLQGADGNSPAIPDGWVMVPVEPTKEMIDAGWSYYMTTKSPSSLGVYGAMLAAAPKQEVKNG